MIEIEYVFNADKMVIFFNIDGYMCCAYSNSLPNELRTYNRTIDYTDTIEWLKSKGFYTDGFKIRDMT